LDDTLYPLSSGLSEACANNIIEFMVEKLGIDEDGVVELNQILYKKYGTSMAGLKVNETEVSLEDYLPRFRYQTSEIAFEKAFDIAQLNPYTTLFFDRQIRNIQTGKAMVSIQSW
ncbi:hypothetical protein Bca52824_097050, partial [Brassica carinata]